ncbi:tryptophan synthase subunit alpha [Desulfopila sp. IMCC35006]|uniref:tryptophan synthase subunit alpha n=1 Tax=Desulfopila sp. IMCC35006 TaxID=2569542 RepID=UPI0010AD8371|nr:tryptophan synthase subunit alpha [Desulfopila sp. IMCC35006]TKB23661.1 tryptophan synthase subunit alpha [Desulfopila sp. IMCC35006]
MLLEKILRNRLEQKKILLMTHIVLGYPSFATNRQVIAQMVDNGVDCIEMQIPFSEPMADGPVILKANQDSLALGTTVADCMAFGAEMSRLHDIPFLFMTYYNIIFKYGEERFFRDCLSAGVKGLIIPDLPPEMGEAFFQLATQFQVAPILIFAPTSTDERMAKLNNSAAGFIYCAARRGVTGKKSEFDDDFNAYLARCRAATSLPIAVGFGIRNHNDVAAITGKADMAVIGSETIRLVEEQGAEAVGPFIKGLR